MRFEYVERYGVSPTGTRNNWLNAVGSLVFS